MKKNERRKYMLIIECIVVCILMFIICFCATGSDQKNLNGLRSYPIEVQDIVRKKYSVKKTNLKKVFVSNLVLFVIVFLIFGFFIRSDDFTTNFINVLVLGEVLNLFDLVIIDLLWWRNTERIRFSFIPYKEMYQNPKMHLDSFYRGILMYFIVAVIDGFILMLL